MPFLPVPVRGGGAGTLQRLELPPSGVSAGNARSCAESRKSPMISAVASSVRLASAPPTSRHPGACTSMALGLPLPGLLSVPCFIARVVVVPCECHAWMCECVTWSKHSGSCAFGLGALLDMHISSRTMDIFWVPWIGQTCPGLSA